MSSKRALSGALYEDSVMAVFCETKACMCSISASSFPLFCAAGPLKGREVSVVSLASTKSWSMASSRVEDGLGVVAGVLVGVGVASVGATVGGTVNTGDGGPAGAEAEVAGLA